MGPRLTARVGELVASIAGVAQFFGVREPASADVVRRLGVPTERVWLAADDASWLAADHTALHTLGLRDGTYVAATFAEHGGILNRDELVHESARLCDWIVKLTGLDVVLASHTVRPSPGASQVAGTATTMTSWRRVGPAT